MKLVPETVRARVTIAATVAAVVVLAAVGWGLAVNLRRSLTDNLDEQLAAVADQVADAVGEGAVPDVERLGEEDWVIQVVGADGSVLAARERPDDDPMRVLSRAVDTPTGTVMIHVAAPSDDIAESVATLRRSLLVAVPLTAAALGMLTWVLVGRTLRPVERIRAEVAEIGGSDLHRRVPVPAADDEVGRLATTMNDMLARVEEGQQRQRRFVADASHELRTPLAIIKANLDLALTDAEATDESRATAAAVIKRAIDRMARLTDDLLALARLDAPASGREPVPLAALLEDAREEFAAAAAAREVELEAAVVPGRIVHGDREVLKRAVTNLLDNAVRIAPEGSSVRLSHGEVDGWAWLAVADEGPGIAPEHQEWIFDRFWRADDGRARPGGGSGLGLAIVRQIAEAHRGSVGVFSDPGAGATFVVWLPRTSDPGEAPQLDPTLVAALA
jgi:signal transduction histidine kinase